MDNDERAGGDQRRAAGAWPSKMERRKSTRTPMSSPSTDQTSESGSPAPARRSIVVTRWLSPRSRERQATEASGTPSDFGYEDRRPGLRSGESSPRERPQRPPYGLQADVNPATLIMESMLKENEKEANVLSKRLILTEQGFAERKKKGSARPLRLVDVGQSKDADEPLSSVSHSSCDSDFDREAQFYSHLSIDEPARRPPYFIVPFSNFHRVWDIILLTLLAYVSTVTVYMISFFGVLGPSSVFFWIDRVTDIVFVLDVLINFRLGHVTDHGTVEYDAVRIAKSYLKGWFFVDVLSAFPWDLVIFYLSGPGETTLFQAPRLLRLFRLIKVLEIERSFRVQLWVTRLEVQFNAKYGRLRMYMFVGFASLLAHWVACLFYFFASVQSGNKSWIHLVDNADTRAEYYIAALYFSVYTITTIGYGDITPESSADRLYAIVAMICGAALFAYTISSVSGLVNELAINDIHYRTLLDQLTEYGNFRSLPTNLKFEIRRYLLLSKQRNRIVGEDQLLSSLSRDLQGKIARHVFGPHLAKSVLLQNVPNNLVDEAYSAVLRRSFSPGEYLFHRGDPATGFYIVLYGRIVLEDENKRLELKPGETFGESDVFFGRSREISAVAETFAEVSILPGEAVMRILGRCPEKHREIKSMEATILWGRAIAIARTRARMTKTASAFRRLIRASSVLSIASEDAPRSSDRGWNSIGGAGRVVDLRAKQEPLCSLRSLTWMPLEDRESGNKARVVDDGRRRDVELERIRNQLSGLTSQIESLALSVAKIVQMTETELQQCPPL